MGVGQYVRPAGLLCTAAVYCKCASNARQTAYTRILRYSKLALCCRMFAHHVEDADIHAGPWCAPAFLPVHTLRHGSVTMLWCSLRLHNRVAKC